MDRVQDIGRPAIFFVKNWFKAIKRGLSMFLIYGEVNEVKSNKKGIEHRVTPYNGLVTSLVVFSFLATFTILLFTTPFISKDEEYKDGIPTKIMLIILMFFGSIIMTIFSSKKEKFLIRKNKTLGLRGRLVLIGITSFFVLGSFLDLFNSIGVLKCFGIYWNCGPQTIKSSVVALLFHVFRVIYLAEQTAFCILYRGYKFKDGCCPRFSLMFLHTANLAMWFDVLLRQTASSMKLKTGSNYWESCKNGVSHYTEHFNSCVFFNGTYSEIIQTYAYNIFYPFLFQFSLLVLECFVHWYVECGSLEKVQFMDVNKRKNTINSSSASTFITTQKNSSLELTTEVSTDENYSHLVKQCFVFITFLNILFGMFNFLPFMVDKDEKRNFDIAFNVYCIVYWLMNIIVIFIGIYCTTGFKENPKKKKFRSLNYLLIISAIGPYLYVITSLHSIFNSELQVLTALKEITFFGSVFCQIPFCFLAGRVVLPSAKDKYTFKVNCFKAITLHLAISNGVLWLVDSFTSAFDGNKDSDHTIYYKKSYWIFLENIIRPLSVFFRFNSFLLFTAAYARMTTFFGKKIYYID